MSLILWTSDKFRCQSICSFLCPPLHFIYGTWDYLVCVGIGLVLPSQWVDIILGLLKIVSINTSYCLEALRQFSLLFSNKVTNLHMVHLKLLSAPQSLSPSQRMIVTSNPNVWTGRLNKNNPAKYSFLFSWAFNLISLGGFMVDSCRQSWSDHHQQ